MGPVVVTSVSQIVTIGFFLLALLFALSRPDDGSAARRWAITAISIFLLTRLSGLLVPGLLSVSVGPSEISNYFAVYSSVTSLLSLAGFTFLIAAVFTGRQRVIQGPSAADGAAGVSDNNPYSATSR